MGELLRMPRGSVAIGVAVLLAAAAHGETSCRDIEDDAERLACYDRLAAAEEAAEEEAQSIRTGPREAERSAATEPVNADETVAEPVAELEAAREPADARDAVAAAQESAATSVRTPAKRRGFFRRALASVKLPNAKPREVVASGKVVRVRVLVLGNVEVELDDGQVWREVEREIRTGHRVGDTVAISRGQLGTFNLDNQRTGRRTKVGRVQ